MQPRARLNGVHLVGEAAHTGAVPGTRAAADVRVDGCGAGRQQAGTRRGQVPLHVGQRARRDEGGDDPGGRDHVDRAFAPVQFGQPVEGVLQLAVLCLGRGPAQQGGIGPAGGLIQPFGQAPDEVVAVLAAEHAALVHLGQPQQAERGDAPVTVARPQRP